MNVTIKDVARAAEVSVATVSRALNGRQYVADEVRARILQVASELRYSPHHAARALSSRRTHTIGVVLPDLYGEFFSELMRGIDHAARERGLHLLVSSCHGSLAEQRDALRATPGRVDGVLVMSPFLGSVESLDEALAPDVPAVLMNCAGSPRAAVLNVDNHGGAFAMTRHLLDVGHRRIAFIAGPEDNFDARERLRGYCEALATVADAAEPWVVQGNFDEASGYAAGEAFAAGERPDAVFAANDMTALGCLFALRKAGLRVPEDIAVAGFDDVPMARYVNPALTTMRVDIASLGARALHLLLQHPALGGESGTPVDTAPLIPHLVVRDSSATPERRMA
ncbi:MULTISPECIES: LacI family DNA-binding transcriptional regulator [Pseudoxanthomonas]|uniref:LacI family transcriptional regulator n=1 Tax=Pseudoxanthomonas winnipegensis TaxID=2480810 RepID=A0A4Q9THD9_9GAMM|nr:MULTISPECIES: LacI family DNA-binding transcriptional regulator [Pseudoxanthomonas]MDQ1118103.1 LacI family transcriptional regulator [Pseudoxanthomonas winnipegensis]MDQ1135073.1 LacI family transcriptional regulator [Pseudoxanthomonas winnipegensis]MDR6138696.1 LacI family transcriptional regulator [Pseudoxanthomonas sp. SORGH_AS_0997]RZZ84741.1 LacI family transcriptional regulator [Pseudoxanthomonas winnipegensis]TAA33682.1 LacI family transcriptional regulator [Pseudoxanthomonas winnip